MCGSTVWSAQRDTKKMCLPCVFATVPLKTRYTTFATSHLLFIVQMAGHMPCKRKKRGTLFLSIRHESATCHAFGRSRALFGQPLSLRRAAVGRSNAVFAPHSHCRPESPATQVSQRDTPAKNTLFPFISRKSRSVGIPYTCHECTQKCPQQRHCSRCGQKVSFSASWPYPYI